MSGQCPVGPDDLDGGEVALNRAYEEEAVSEKPPEAFVKWVRGRFKSAVGPTVKVEWDHAFGECWRAAQAEVEERMANECDGECPMIRTIRERAKEGK